MFEVYMNIAEIESDNIDNWDNIKFYNETELYSGEIGEIYVSNIKTSFCLIRFNSTKKQYSNIKYFYTYKIFQSFLEDSIPKMNKKEILVNHWCYYDDNGFSPMVFVISNISNLRTFESKESSNIIHGKEYEYFSYIILPTEENYELNIYHLKKSLFGRSFYKEIYFRQDLSYLFSSISEKFIWYFDINDNYTFAIQYYFGNTQIYYSEVINEEIIRDLSIQKLDKFKKLNTSNNIMNFNSPFALYIETSEFALK